MDKSDPHWFLKCGTSAWRVSFKVRQHGASMQKGGANLLAKSLPKTDVNANRKSGPTLVGFGGLVDMLGPCPVTTGQEGALIRGVAHGVQFSKTRLVKVLK